MLLHLSTQLQEPTKLALLETFFQMRQPSHPLQMEKSPHCVEYTELVKVLMLG